MKTSRQQLSFTIALLCLIALLLSDVFTVQCQPNTTVDEYDCSNETYAEGSGYAAEVDYGLEQLTYTTPTQPQYQYTITGSYATGFAYCQLYVAQNDCTLCLEAAADFLLDDCPMSVAAYVAMIDCGMRYDPINNGPTAACVSENTCDGI